MRRSFTIGFLSLVVCLLSNQARAMYFDPTNGFYYEPVDSTGTWYQVTFPHESYQNLC
jgi:hypothetical protein